MIVSLSFHLSRLPSARVPARGQQRTTLAAPMCALTTRHLLLVPVVLVSLGLAGCAGSLARDVADASNRPGGVFAVVPCRHNPDISGALRTTVKGSDKRKKCDAVWTHATASQEQLVEDMTACSKAAFWVLSPSAAQDQRLACMESKGYRRETQHDAGSPPKAAATEATAQRAIPSWLAGTWVAVAPSPGGAHMQDTFQLTVKDDGTFEEIVNSARGGRIDVFGRWQVSGETAILEGVYQGGPSFIQATKKTVTLRRDGDSLDGTRVTHYNNQTHPIRFTKPAPATFSAPTGETAAPVAADAPASWPLTHIDDTKTIAGTWTGTAALPGTQAVPVTMVLREDGSYESSTPSTRFIGSYGITGGKARYRSTTSGRTGTIELRERDGQRRLIIIIDGGGRAELRPVPN